MKIIGAKIRFGTTNRAQIEAKVVPFNILVPDLFTKGNSFWHANVSVTVHTSQGDVTLNGLLPLDGSWEPSVGVSENDLDAAYAEFRKAIEAS